MPKTVKTDQQHELWTLADGSDFDPAGATPDELMALQYDQEKQFSKAILNAPRLSRQRLEITCRAYALIEQIYTRIHQKNDELLNYGVDERYIRLVCQLLERQKRDKIDPEFLEIGFGTGLLLDGVKQAGFSISGLEISEGMKAATLERLGSGYDDRLHVGGLLDFKPSRRPTLIYSNDVIEHIAPDETLDYLKHLYQMLAPGGVLVTVTPSWHERPSDVTRLFAPPRTEAQGLHLKEYQLSEMVALLREAGFEKVTTPLIQIPGKRFGRIFLGHGGQVRAKCRLEGLLEKMPVQLAIRLSRLAGLSITLAKR
jgi:SAM-dependent methyltransferase